MNETPDLSPDVEIYVTTDGELSHAHRRNLAAYAREVLGGALTIKGIAGSYRIEITDDNDLMLRLTPHEAHHLAHTLKEAGE